MLTDWLNVFYDNLFRVASKLKKQIDMLFVGFQVANGYLRMSSNHTHTHTYNWSKGLCVYIY